MTRRWCLGSLAAIAGLVVPVAAGAADATNIVAFRQAVMQLLDGHVNAIEDVVQGNVDFTGHVAGHAVSIEQLSSQLTALFPVATGPGDVATNALQDIWADDAGFAAAAQSLQQAAAELTAAALADDQLAVVVRFNDLRRNGCDGCHASFRRRPSQ